MDILTLKCRILFELNSAPIIGKWSTVKKKWSHVRHGSSQPIWLFMFLVSWFQAREWLLWTSRMMLISSVYFRNGHGRQTLWPSHPWAKLVSMGKASTVGQCTTWQAFKRFERQLQGLAGMYCFDWLTFNQLFKVFFCDLINNFFLFVL